MARNTNIQDILFNVWQEPVYLEGQKNSIQGFKAIVGKPNGTTNVFSVVSDQYQLITNELALDLGKQIHQKLFPGANANSFEVFKVITPETKSFCHIDIIDKNYTLNVWAQEIYVPFIRIHNSYNRTRSLKFDIGFCRKLCNNGVIFEQDAVSLTFAHTKEAIRLDNLDGIDVSHLKKLEEDFIKKTKRSFGIPLPRKYFVPLAAKTLGRTFNLNEKDPVKLKLIQFKMDAFVQSINKYANRYIHTDRFGETAYAFYNVITDYASNHELLSANAINGLQTKCGLWINEVGELDTRNEFSWDKEVEHFEYLLQ